MRKERRTNGRFPVTVDIQYADSDQNAPLARGSGRTIDMSTSWLRFTADRPLPPGLSLDLFISWPFLHDQPVQVQLIASGVVVRTTGTETVLRLDRRQFVTRQVGGAPH